MGLIGASVMRRNSDRSEERKARKEALFVSLTLSVLKQEFNERLKLNVLNRRMVFRSSRTYTTSMFERRETSSWFEGLLQSLFHHDFSVLSNGDQSRLFNEAAAKFIRAVTDAGYTVVDTEYNGDWIKFGVIW